MSKSTLTKLRQLSLSLSLSRLTPRHKSNSSKAFTIVELLVVIVVIGILATITIVSYRGISDKAITAAIQSDLVNASKQLKLFQVENSSYPNSITDCPTPAAGNKCLKPSGSDIYTSYVKDNTVTPQGFCINVTNGTKSYKITSTTTLTPIEGDCATTTVTQTQDFTTVGANTFNTNSLPAGVTSVQIEAWGAQGGSGGERTILLGHGGAGGSGGKILGNLVVAPSQTLEINIGQQGSHGTDVTTWIADCAGAGGSGGSTTVTRSSVLLASASGGAGGGGGCYDCIPGYDAADEYDPCLDASPYNGSTGSVGSGNWYSPLIDGVITPGVKTGNGRVLLTWQVVTLPVF